MSQEDDLNYLNIPSPERLASAAAAHRARELLPIPHCPRRAWMGDPDGPIFLDDLIALEERITSKECLDRFMGAQVEKFRAGKDFRCSEGLTLKIRRKALEADMDL